MNTSDVLNKAADLIEERGWTIGAVGFDWGLHGSEPVCVEGAIYAVLEGRNEDGHAMASDDINACPAGIAVRSYLELEKPIWYWNDGHVSASTSATASAVVEVLRAAAIVEAAKSVQVFEVSA